MRLYLLQIIAPIICFLAANNSFGIDIPKTPFLKNYTKTDYNARPQNWAVVQDDNNRMYFANNEGVLQFDGVKWDKILMPNKSIVRSLYFIGGDTILVGAYSEFGIIFHNKKGDLVYESWNQKLPLEYTNCSEIWRIHKIGERIIIQSFTHLIIFEGGTFVKAILSEKTFMFSFVVNQTLYIQQPNLGLFKLSNSGLILVNSSEVFKNMEVWAFLPFNENQILVGTQFNGFFLYDGISIIPWVSEANEFIKKNNLFSAVAMTNGNFVFGSIQNGLIIVNKNGEILTLENTTLGLQNNTVLSLFEDNAQNLWLGLDNGIDYVKTNSPLSYVRKKGGFGTGYTSLIFNNKLYAGTNQGLFYLPLDKSALKIGQLTDFEIIESTRGQVWCLRSFGDKLFCGHNVGLFLITDNGAKQIGNITGVWDIVELPYDTDHLLLGTYEGFYLLNKHSFELIKMKGFDESARHFLFYNGNKLIVSHGYKGIYDISIDMQQKSIEVINYYDGSKYLPNKVGNDVFRFNNNIIVTTDSGVFTYKNNEFAFYNVWNDIYGGNANRISNIIDVGNSKYWCFKDGQASYLTFLNENMFELNTRDFLSISNTFPTSYENVLKIKDESFLIGNEDGFVFYEGDGLNRTKEKIIIKVSSIEYKYKGENSYNSLEFKENVNGIQVNKLNYNKHRLKIILSIPFYTDQNLVQYRYRLNNGPWLDWVSGNELKLDDLREGTYLIDLQCSIDKEVIAGELAIKFTIDPPLFRRWYSYVFYLFLFFAAALFSSALIKKRIANEKRREGLKQQKQMIEKQLKFQREAELAQGELINLRNERLKTDIRHKSKELANTTMSLINKNKILQQFKDVLADIKKEDVRYRENNKINNLIKKINKEIEHQDNWVVFEENFDKVHENFLQRLKGKHADLTPKDLRLAAYLRMNLSSKEIAPLLNISIRSVEISRYRLRKKMDLDHDENLTEYLIST